MADRGRNLVVVRLGGAELETGALPFWRGALDRAAVPIVVVPGGGPFADTVRDWQDRLGYDDRAAHRMALHAMAQAAEAVAASSSRLKLVSAWDAVGVALDGGRVPVLSAAPLLFDDADLPASWDVTSDSIAAHVAARLGATDLLLLKAVDRPAGATIQSLADDRIIDRAFPAFAARFAGAVRLSGPALRERTAAAWAEGEAGGEIVRPALRRAAA